MELRAAVLHYCKYQERCHSEVRSKLYDLGFNSEEVEQQLSALIETGVINEERYAKAFAGGKFRMKQWGREKIKQQLKIKRISDYCIKKALTEIDADEYDNTLAKLAAKKYAEVKKDRSLLSRKSKMYRHLVQKGYERDMVMNVINECMNTK